MKKTTILLAFIFAFKIGISQTNNVDFTTKTVTTNNKRTGRLLGSAGAFYIIGGGLMGANALGNDKHFQLASGSSFVIGSLFLMLAAENIYSSRLVDSEKAYINIKASPGSIGLCLNFK